MGFFGNLVYRWMFGDYEAVLHEEYNKKPPIFGNVWFALDNRFSPRPTVYSKLPYSQLSQADQEKVREYLGGIKRFTLSASHSEFEIKPGIWKQSVCFSVPGDFASSSPFIEDDPKYPGLAAILHKAYEV